VEAEDTLRVRLGIRSRSYDVPVAIADKPASSANGIVLALYSVVPTSPGFAGEWLVAAEGSFLVAGSRLRGLNSPFGGTTALNKDEPALLCPDIARLCCTVVSIVTAAPTEVLDSCCRLSPPERHVTRVTVFVSVGGSVDTYSLCVTFDIFLRCFLAEAFGIAATGRNATLFPGSRGACLADVLLTVLCWSTG
jgi:hypothetical protein